MKLSDFETRTPIYSPDGMLLPHVWITTWSCVARPVPGDKRTLEVTATPIRQRLVRSPYSDAMFEEAS